MSTAGEREVRGGARAKSQLATLNDLGITKSLSSRWQLSGTVPTRYHCVFSISCLNCRPNVRSHHASSIGAAWPCGQLATDALAAFISGEPVSCRARGEDRYGRTVAACTVRGEDIGAWLVRSGWALAYRLYSLDYADEETAAQANRVGIWRGVFVLPWKWRQGVRLE